MGVYLNGRRVQPVPANQIKSWAPNQSNSVGNLVMYQFSMWQCIANDTGLSPPNANSNFRNISAEEVRAGEIDYDVNIQFGFNTVTLPLGGNGADDNVVLPLTQIIGFPAQETVFQRDADDSSIFICSAPVRFNFTSAKLFRMNLAWTYRNQYRFTTPTIQYRINTGTWTDLFYAPNVQAQGPEGVQTAATAIAVFNGALTNGSFSLVRNDRLQFRFLTTFNTSFSGSVQPGAGIGNLTLSHPPNLQRMPLEADINITETHRLIASPQGELFRQDVSSNNFDLLLDQFGVIQGAGRGLKLELLWEAGVSRDSRLATPSTTIAYSLIAGQHFDTYQWIYVETDRTPGNHFVPYVVPVERFKAYTGTSGERLVVGSTSNSGLALQYVNSTQFKLYNNWNIGLRRIYGIV